jgi:hypothetical protein
MANTKAKPEQKELENVTDAETEPITTEETAEDILDAANKELDEALAPPDASVESEVPAVPEQVTHTPPAELPPMRSASDLIAYAMANGADLDKLDRLFAMRDREEARAFKMEFDRNFALMQREFKPVPRSREARNEEKNETMFKYAPVDAMQKINGQIIADHGFTYRWREEPIDINGASGIRVTLYITGYGHTETFPVEVPIPEPNRRTNATQCRGIASTYGRRYSFVGGFGFTLEDEDDEQELLSFTDGVKYAEYVNAIEATTTVDDAHEVGKTHYLQLKEAGDTHGMNVISRVTESHKGYLKAKEQVNARH